MVAATPVSSTGALRLSLPQKLSVSATPAAKLFSQNTSNAQLKDKVVIIGRDAEFGENFRTARGEVTLAAAHALAASQLLQQATPLRPSWTGYSEALAVIIAWAGCNYGRAKAQLLAGYGRRGCRIGAHFCKQLSPRIRLRVCCSTHCRGRLRYWRARCRLLGVSHSALSCVMIPCAVHFMTAYQNPQ